MLRRTPLSAAEALEQMSEDSVTCRDLAHAWKPWRAARIDGGYERTLRCRTCGSERIELLDSRGGLVKRRYAYAEGYRVPGFGRMDSDFRSRVRLTNILKGLG